MNDMAERCRQASKAIDLSLAQKAADARRTLSPNHDARLAGWQMPLRDVEEVLVRYTRAEFEQLDRIGRFAELVRCEAQAWLIHEQLGYVLLGDVERNDLLSRALGILPADEADRFAEIACLYDVSPQHILVDPAHFLTGTRMIAGAYGIGTALGYGLLVAGGVRAKADLIKYGEMIQLLFDRITLAQPVARLLARISSDDIREAPFTERYALLIQVHDQLLKARTERLGPEFRLNRILESALHQHREDRASVLGLVSLDAVILTKLLFTVRLVAVEGSMFIGVCFDEKQVCWESTPAAPVSGMPFQSGSGQEIFALLARTYHEIGIWNSRQGQLTRAIAAFKQALALNPESPETLTELSQVHLRSNQPNEAIATAQQAVILAPKSAGAFVTLGSAFLMREMPDEAIEALKKATKLKPDSAEAVNNLGFAYGQKGETERAITAFKTAIRLQPKYAEAHFNLGNACLAADKPEAAIDAYRKAIRVNPSLVRAYYNLGQVCYQQGMLNEAIKAYKKTLRLNPKHAGALYNLGIAYRDKGMKKEAVEAIEQAITLNPNLLR